MTHLNKIAFLCLFALSILTPQAQSHSGCLGILAAGAGGTGGGQAVRVLPANQSLQLVLIEEGVWNRRLGLQSQIYLCMDMNAFAAPDQKVYLGQPLVDKMRLEKGDAFAWQASGFILSHEYGHEFQFKTLRRMQREASNGPELELQADILGGYWFGGRLREQTGQNPLLAGAAESIADIARRAAYDFGDYAFNSPQHHGTPEQRQKAVEYGLTAGRQSKCGTLDSAFLSRGQELYDWSKARVAEILNGSPEPEPRPRPRPRPNPAPVDPAPTSDENAVSFVEVSDKDVDYDPDTHKLTFAITYKNNSNRQIEVTTVVKAKNGGTFVSRPGENKILKSQSYQFTLGANGTHAVEGAWRVQSDPGFGDPELLYGGADEEANRASLKAKFGN